MAQPSEEELAAKLFADRALEKLREHSAQEEALQEGWREAKKRYVELARARLPEPEELIYAHSQCPCGAHLAYRPDTDPREWMCSDVLLGNVGTPEDKALVAEESWFGGQKETPKEHEGKVVHRLYPFSFWKIKEDRTRKSPR